MIREATGKANGQTGELGVVRMERGRRRDGVRDKNRTMDALEGVRDDEVFFVGVVQSYRYSKVGNI